MLAAAGCRKLFVSSMVRPAIIPQMAATIPIFRLPSIEKRAPLFLPCQRHFAGASGSRAFIASAPAEPSEAIAPLPDRLLVAASFHGGAISLPKVVKAAQSVSGRAELVSRDKEWVILRVASTGTYISMSRRGAVVVTYPVGADGAAQTAAVEVLLKTDGVLQVDGGADSTARPTPVDAGQPPRETLSIVLLPPEATEAFNGRSAAGDAQPVIRMTAAAATAAAGGCAPAAHGIGGLSTSGSGGILAGAGSTYAVAPQPPSPYAFIDHRGALVVRSAKLELDALRVINAAAAATVTMMAWEATVAARFAELPAKLFAALEKAGGSERSWVASMLRGLRAGSASPELEPARLYRALSEVSAITNALELGLRTINRPGSAAWNDARYAELFECLEEEFEMGERSADLTRSLAQISEAIKYALDVRKDSKSLALERIIVVLIAVEIVISLAHHAAQ